jgi:hypothetical protein
MRASYGPTDYIRVLSLGVSGQIPAIVLYDMNSEGVTAFSGEAE